MSKPKELHFFDNIAELVDADFCEYLKYF